MPQLPPEVLEYEQQLIKRGKRRKIVVGLVIGTLFAIGAGSCVGPLGVTIASDAWRSRKTQLTPEEQKRVNETLDPIEANAKKSQAALSSEHITFRSNDVDPLRRDLVLELEHELDKNFVASGDAPPKLERPPPSTQAALEALVNQMEEASDAGVKPDAGKPAPRTKKRPKAP